ncbi:hypothetical protein AK812_SmicGene34292 [Symbiodinium microadriaticum]|uniref:Uncharacterized protein n=2 Tax=Symbiodinium TaxID=2949 RepID=A0A1Q9CPD4_SYMMI|nr:hypothetical protein AK812_SmicGene34292 [Symbiodinium microadriaticum]
MALSLRFLSQASKNIVAHAPSPRAACTPITPKTPKTPKSPQSPLSPLSTACTGLSFFPVEEAKRAPKTARRSVHFADESGAWVGNASSLLSAKGLGLLGKFQPDARAQATLDHSVQEEDPMALAAATRAAVLARKARQEDRCVPTPRVALEPTFPVLLGRRPSVGLPMKSPLSFLNEESCAQAARQAFLEQQERRASRAMVDFVVQYLAEVTELRDRIRSSTLSSSMQAALAEITDEGDGGDHGIYRFQPEIALDPKTQEYFKAAMQENMKIALTKGAAAAGETIQLLMSQLTDAQSELEKLREQLEDALLQAKLSEGIEKRPPPPRKVSVVDASSQEQVKKLQAELDALRAEFDAAKQDSERQKAILQVFGLEASATLDDARKLWESLNSPGDDWAGEAEKLREKNKALLKQSKTLEEELAEYKKKNYEETCRKLQSQVSDLQAEIEKLKQQLATKNMPSKGDGANEENEALKRQLAMLKKQVEAGKGDSAVKDLMKQNEALEAELAALKKQLTEKVAEVQETTKVADAARRQSTDLMGQVELMRKELERAKKDLDSERRRSAALEAAVEAAAEEGANGDSEGLAQANNRVRKLEQTLKGAREENDLLKKENGVLKEQLEEAKIMRKALEQAMEELRRKFEDFKRRLQEKGVDVSILDEALAEAGMPLHPMSVFDRLYKDAIRRQNRSQEKWVVDMRNAQQETWERILGIYDGPPLTKEQVNALVENGLIDIRMFGMEPKEAKEPRMFCPRCGSTMRASTPDDASAQPRPHTHGASLSERSKPKLERVRTWAGSVTSLRTAGAVAVPQGALTYTNAEAFTRKDLYLDIVGFHPASPLQERRPFAIVSEADQYRKHCRLQRFTEPNALDLPPAGSSQSPKAREGSPMSPSKSEAGSSPEAPPVSPASAPQAPLDFTLTPTASSAAKLEPPPTATLDSASAMTLDLRETQVKSPPPMLSEPAAPPLQQRRISARDAKIVDGAGDLSEDNVDFPVK